VGRRMRYEYLHSVVSSSKPPAKKSKYPSALPLDLCELIVKMYTKRGDFIVDPFCGAGSILIAAAKCERWALGIDINEEAVRVAEERILEHKADHRVKVLLGDALEIDKYVESCDHIITHPPYAFAIKYKRGDRRELSNLTYSEFLDKMKIFIEKASMLFKRYFILIVGDVRKRDRIYPLHADLIKIAGEILTLRDIGIWEYGVASSYSYIKPYSVVTREGEGRFAIHHNYILVFTQ